MSRRKPSQLTHEERTALQSKAGKAARKASPWNKGPNCDSYRARLSYMRVRGAAKKESQP